MESEYMAVQINRGISPSAAYKVPSKIQSIHEIPGSAVFKTQSKPATGIKLARWDIDPPGVQNVIQGSHRSVNGKCLVDLGRLPEAPLPTLWALPISWIAAQPVLVRNECEPFAHVIASIPVDLNMRPLLPVPVALGNNHKRL
jgi:hypothetical protein